MSMWDRDPEPHRNWVDMLLCAACAAIAFYCLMAVFSHVP